MSIAGPKNPKHGAYPVVNLTEKSHDDFQPSLHHTSTSGIRSQKPAGLLTRWQNLANTYWLYEAMSCFISLFALGALIVVLVTFNGRARPRWPDFVSINTLIAVVTAILKATLMLPIAEGISELKWQWFAKPRILNDISTYDSASRGPWGSFLFLFSIRQHLLASFGAFITICALAIDPFSQQVLKYQDCLEPNAALAARIPRTNSYSARGPRLQAAVAVLDTPMTLTIYNGILAPPNNPSSLVTTSCPSGNCTFGTDGGASYSSIAICQRSQDISHHIQNYTTQIALNYSLPSGPTVGNMYVLSSNVIDYRWPNGTVKYENLEDKYLENMLFTYEILTLSNTFQPSAFRASLYPCIKTWGGNITRGELVETELTSIPTEYTEGYGVSQVTNETLRNGTWQSCNPTAQRTDINVVAVKSYDTADPGPITNATSVSNIANDTVLWYPSDCVWKFERMATAANAAFLRTLFQYNNVTRSATGGAVQGDLWLVNLRAGGSANISSVNSFMDNLAAHMTATIRSTGDITVPPHTNYVSGTVWENQTCVHVRWSWLSLPASMVVCSILFLVATIVSTSSARHQSYAHLSLTAAGPLKSSPLPLLFHGIEPSTLRALSHPSSLDDMQRVAGNLEVRLGRSLVDENWYFVHDKRE